MTRAPHRFQEIREVALPKAAAWNVLRHTDRINRRLGLPAVTYDSPETSVEGTYRIARAKMMGIPLEWKEYPFSWETEGRYSVVRVYNGGPIERIELGTEFEEIGPNLTRLTFFADATPRGVAGKILVPLMIRQSLQSMLAITDSDLANASVVRIKAPDPPKSKANDALLRRLCDSLKRRPLKPEVVDALETLLRAGGDDEVTSLRPFEWARYSHLNRNEALRVCLHAVKENLLDLRWAMMCPNCRVSKREVSKLSEVESTVHCDMCGVNYDLNFDRYVELRFAVQPAVRNAAPDTYCIGGPFRAPHILIQRQVSPGQRTFIPRLLKHDDMRLRVMKWNKNVAISAESEAPTEIIWNGHEWSHSEARGSFDVVNNGPEPIIIALEKLDWDADAVTAAQVTAMQEFRDLFSGEVLAPGREMAVENVTIFFSDLSNSTAMYERIGDAPAFARVGRHFEFLQEHIATAGGALIDETMTEEVIGGAVVKTMGDAVMAVFSRPADAVRAALALQREFPLLSQSEGEDEIALKIGLHFGPALAVNSNDRSDYFGRTVNIAARVSAAAKGGEIMWTQSVWQHPEVRALVAQSGAHFSKYCTRLRGVEEDFDLIRVRF